MIKNFGKIFLITFLVIAFTGSVYAFGNTLFSASNARKVSYGYIGGSIANIQASEVQTYEAAGYDCLIPGTTVEIASPLGEHTAYFIPTWVTSATGHTPTIGQQILGMYGGQTTISCTRDEWKIEGGGGFLGLGGREVKLVTSQHDIILNNLLYFGTSPF